MNLKIGELSRATDTNAPTIRYYEQIGLLPRPSRTSGQRRYGDEDVRRLTFIRRCRNFGFPIEQVRILASLLRNSERSCSDARDLAEAHLAAVREKMRELRALEQNIAALLEASDGACHGGPGADCVMLKGLAEPAQWSD